MKRIFAILMTLVFVVGCVTACSCGVEKNITVVVREQGSGTREAFDKVVTNGEHFLQEKDGNGNTVYNASKESITYSSTGSVLSAIESDKNAIGYVSLGSLTSNVKVIKVNGAEPTKQTVLNGSYAIQRPFVVMTNSKITLSARADDFMNYLKSASSEAHCEAAGTIFLSDPSARANEGDTPISVVNYTKQATLPSGNKIVVRGSTSMEKFINAAAKGYADMYGVNADEIFDIELTGSSDGRRAVEEDKTGNVIGLSSASVNKDGIDSFNVCLDAVAVIVNQANAEITDLTIEQLYKIFSGDTKKFSEINN